MSHPDRKAVTCKATPAGCVDNEFQHDERAALSIAAVARMFGVSTLTLRLYELRKLIRRERADRGWVYSWKDCERIALILKARKAGLGVAQIAAVILAMDERATIPVIQRGRLQCQTLIYALEVQQQAGANASAELGRIDGEQTVADILAELDRIDYELAERLAFRTEDTI
jgi:DNA-binding transcriptional MerR regulator